MIYRNSSISVIALHICICESTLDKLENFRTGFSPKILDTILQRKRLSLRGMSSNIFDANTFPISFKDKVGSLVMGSVSNNFI
jgi:hypothetical protein